MDWINMVQKALNFIEENLQEDINAERIAQNVYASSAYFQKIFSIVTGYPVGDYIRNRRLSLAGEEIAGGKIKVIDVALKYGYESPESFTKAFARFHGITPSSADATDEVYFGGKAFQAWADSLLCDEWFQNEEMLSGPLDTYRSCMVQAGTNLYYMESYLERALNLCPDIASRIHALMKLFSNEKKRLISWLHFKGAISLKRTRMHCWRGSSERPFPSR